MSRWVIRSWSLTAAFANIAPAGVDGASRRRWHVGPRANTLTQSTARATQPPPARRLGWLRNLAPTRRVRVLALADGVALFALMWAIHGVRWAADLMTTVYPWPTYLAGFTLATAVHLVVFYFGGLYEPEQRLGSSPKLPRAFALTALAVLICAGIALLSGQYLMPRGNLAVLLVGGALVVAGNRRALRRVRLWRHGVPRLLLVGAPDDVSSAVTHLEDAGTRRFDLAGTAGEDDDLLAAVTDTGATDVLLLSGRRLHDVYPEPLNTFEREGVGVLQVVRPSDSLLGLRGVSELGGMPVVALRSHVMGDSQRQLKRLIDLGLLLVTAPLFVPLTGLVAAYVAVRAGRPVLYHQQRVGRDGQPFELVKFRTMRCDAERHSGPVLAAVRDPRVLPGLQWLRETRLDELPQLLHVLTGRMAMVGPRPERPELVERYDQLIPGYERRREVPPGVTGLAQVHGRYHTDPEHKLGHDLQYLVNWSPVLDVQILTRTIWVILSRRL